MFTFYLLEALDGKGEVESGGKVTVRNLNKHVDKRMKAHKQHECRFWNFGAGDAADLPLVFPSRGSIGTILAGAAGCLAQDTQAHPDPRSLFEAIMLADDALKRYAEALNGQTLEKDINERLQVYAQLASEWKLNHCRDYLLSDPAGFRQLTDMRDEMSLQQVLQHDTQWRTVLESFCRLVMLGRGDPKSLFNALAHQSGRLPMAQAAIN
jgi:hypothetical protein